MSHGGNPDQTRLQIDASAVGDVSVVTLAGEVDAASVAALRDRVEELAVAGHTNQVLDLSNVGFLDSSGLGALVALRRRLESVGGALVLACDNEAVLRLLRLTSLDTVLVIFPTVGAALDNGFRRLSHG